MQFLTKLVELLDVDVLGKPLTAKSKDLPGFAVTHAFYAFIAFILANLPYMFDEPLHVLHSLEKVIGQCFTHCVGLRCGVLLMECVAVYAVRGAASIEPFCLSVQRTYDGKTTLFACHISVRLLVSYLHQL